MRAERLYKNNTHSWLMLGRDDNPSCNVNDASQYLIENNGRGLLLDPSGAVHFSQVAAEFSKQFDLSNVEAVFVSYYDPDMISSLSLWTQVNPKLKIYISEIWSVYLYNFGIKHDQISPVPDKGGVITLGGHDLEVVPAHYLHSAGNLSLYDPEAKILFSGDIGAGFLPDDFTDLYVTDFSEYTQNMEFIHRRWMTSNAAKSRWITEIRKRDVEMLCPAHGAIFKGEDVERFLAWFENLDVGSGWSSVR